MALETLYSAVALMGALLDLTVEAVMRNGDIRGRLIETFVLSQLRPEESLGPGPGRRALEMLGT